MSEAAERFRIELARNRTLGDALDDPQQPLAQLVHLQEWQRSRLAETYSDLLASDQYRAACRFFLDELYGGLEFRERDRQVGRAAPVLTRTLPGRALDALAEAFALQAISVELDLAVAKVMRERDVDALDTERYAEVYRAAGHDEAREQQLELIRSLGHDLGKLVQWPLLPGLLRLMRGPAKAAGFGELQDFLEDGFGAFRRMGDAAPFVETIYNRERQVRDRLLAAEDDPFSIEAAAEVR